MEREKLGSRLGFILLSAGCAPLAAEMSGNSPGCAANTVAAASFCSIFSAW